MSGFDNEVLYADNVDFRGVQPVVAQITADGQLLIGAASGASIRAATLTGGTGIDVTNAAGSISLAVDATALPTIPLSFTTDGSPAAPASFSI